MKQLNRGAVIRLDDRMELRSEVREKVEIELISQCPDFAEAELLEMSPHGCRIRIPRNGGQFNPREIRIRFAGTQIAAQVMWTMTSDEHVDIGLLMLSDVFRT
jgi:hypothetical protein